MIRLLNRLISMDDNRLTKCVLNFDYIATGKTWCSDLKHLHQVNMQQSFESKHIVNWASTRENMSSGGLRTIQAQTSLRIREV